MQSVTIPLEVMSVTAEMVTDSMEHTVKVRCIWNALLEQYR